MTEAERRLRDMVAELRHHRTVLRDQNLWQRRLLDGVEHNHPGLLKTLVDELEFTPPTVASGGLKPLPMPPSMRA